MNFGRVKLVLNLPVQLFMVDSVESLVFFLAGTLTRFTLLAIDSLLEAVLDAELLLKDTSVLLSNPYSL